MVRSKAAMYAALAVIEIARRERGQGVRAREIADLFGLPPAYAAKVMTQLTRAKILASDRGPRGGFRLARDPSAISFLEIVEAVEGAMGAQGLFPDPAEREQVHRGMVELFELAIRRMRDCLGASSVADFLRNGNGDAAHPQRSDEGTWRVPPMLPPSHPPHRLAVNS
jgi:Rrf2 family protein